MNKSFTEVNQINDHGGLIPSSIITKFKCNSCADILIIDDNVFNILALKLLLDQIPGKLGFSQALKIDTATDGVFGIEQLAKKINHCCR